MKLYLDMCALKRPFDDQSNGRVAIETQAVMQILGWFDADKCVIVNSEALVVENSFNTKLTRRARVATMLQMFGKPLGITARTMHRAASLRILGFGDMDALHIACAEHADADMLVTCDDGLVARARNRIELSVINPVDLVREHSL